MWTLGACMSRRIRQVNYPRQPCNWLHRECMYVACTCLLLHMLPPAFTGYVASPELYACTFKHVLVLSQQMVLWCFVRSKSHVPLYLCMPSTLLDTRICLIGHLARMCLRNTVLSARIVKSCCRYLPPAGVPGLQEHLAPHSLPIDEGGELVQLLV